MPRVRASVTPPPDHFWVPGPADPLQYVHRFAGYLSTGIGDFCGAGAVQFGWGCGAVLDKLLAALPMSFVAGRQHGSCIRSPFARVETAGLSREAKTGSDATLSDSIFSFDIAGKEGPLGHCRRIGARIARGLARPCLPVRGGDAGVGSLRRHRQLYGRCFRRCELRRHQRHDAERQLPERQYHAGVRDIQDWASSPAPMTAAMATTAASESVPPRETTATPATISP